MISNLLRFCFFFFFHFSLYGQTIVEGTIRNSSSDAGLPYANIGVEGENIGTVSNIRGQFKLSLDEKWNEKTLKISAIGFKTKSIKVGSFKQQIQDEGSIYLDEEAYDLEEIEVQAKKLKNRRLKEKILGNQTSTKNNRTGFATNLLGNEMGIVIKVKNKPVWIQEFNIFVTDNQYEEFKFRINFYNLKDGLPYQNILKENIIITNTINGGWVRADLRDYHIILEEDFFVAMEWIEDLGDHGLFFSTKANGKTSPTITRKTSHGKWIETGKLSYNNGIGIHLKVLQ